jgi:hypothetical protein
MSGESITVIKRNQAGEEIWRYAGRVLSREPNAVLLEAFFNRDDMPFLDLVLKRNDRYVEKYFTDRWYNVFRVHDCDDDRVKGWYCNIGRPAVMEADDRLSYIDLVLDLWVSPDGEQKVLDQDEFEQLPLDQESRMQARAALAELQGMFKMGRPPV